VRQGALEIYLALRALHDGNHRGAGVDARERRRQTKIFGAAKNDRVPISRGGRRRRRWTPDRSEIHELAGIVAGVLRGRAENPSMAATACPTHLRCGRQIGHLPARCWRERSRTLRQGVET